jgi:hypothetical protein
MLMVPHAHRTCGVASVYTQKTEGWQDECKITEGPVARQHETDPSHTMICFIFQPNSKINNCLFILQI